MATKNLSDYQPIVRRPGRVQRLSTQAVEKNPEELHRSSHHARPVDLDAGAATAESKASVNSAEVLEHGIWSTKQGLTFAYAGLFLFTFVLYFRPYELIPALSSLSSIAFYIALGTLLIFLPSHFALEGTLTARPREVNLLLLLCLTALLSIPLAINPKEAWETFNDVFIKAVLMFVVMINVVRTERRLRQLLLLSIAVSVVLSFSALSKYRSGNFDTEGYRVGGIIGGMFGNPNDMSLHLVTTLPLVIVLFCSSKSVVKKILYATCATLIVAGNTVTFSRGGSIGIVVVAVVLCWKLGRRNRFAVLAVGSLALIIFMAFAPGGYGVRLLSIFVPSLDPVGSSSQRKELLIKSVMVSLHNPIFGVGMGNYHILSSHELVSHNAYTQVSAEMGLTAFACYVMFMLTPLKKLRQIERENFEANNRSGIYYLAIGLQASIIGYMFSSFFLSVAYQWYIYYLVGYAVCLRRIYQSQLLAGSDAPGGQSLRPAPRPDAESLHPGMGQSSAVPVRF